MLVTVFPGLAFAPVVGGAAAIVVVDVVIAGVAITDSVVAVVGFVAGLTRGTRRGTLSIAVRAGAVR